MTTRKHWLRYNTGVSCALPSEFHPIITEWFSARFSEPTEPQRLGWPLIGQGKHTLILAPTGSGKTLAAFLAAINRVLIDLEKGAAPEQGVEIVYISPLKALSYDIERNLNQPLKEMQDTAARKGWSIPEIKIAVRTGDTPSEERRRMIKRPPHILITTPESLHIILTSSARTVLQTVRYVIVDEIHSLSPNKRGVFLSVLLERLENLCSASPVRIGLSATQKPLEETARFLGGFDDRGKPRPVEIVDAGIRRDIDLKVIAPCDDLRHPEAGSVWPSICETLLRMIRSHKSTIIFANTRRAVERLTIGINELAGEELVKPHHGSVSPEIRRRTEEELKAGALRGVVATGTLELGIDMGSVDLVCQVESPKEVSRGLQRVGRAGHAYKGKSKGRIIPKTCADLAESAAAASAMMECDIEPTRVPKNCLDILAQQIVAMAAVEGTTVSEVFATVRRTYAFHELTEEAFNLTLELVSGRYPSRLFRDLRPRISLDRATGRISPLPGTQRLVITNGGAIPDTGEYPVYLAGTDVRLGELDEEFVYESREGDVFSLGTNNWKIVRIDADRVWVTFATSNQARMPFWRGESVPRSAAVGKRMGALFRAIEECPDNLGKHLMEQFYTDERAAQNLVRFVNAQMASVGAAGLPTDRRIVLETFKDEIGSTRLAVLSIFGGRVHQALRIAIAALVKHHTGVEPESVSGDNGILFRLPDCEIPAPDRLFLELTPERAQQLILTDLPNTALFGLRFRQNAARALLLPAGRPGTRTPLWLQRLKAKDLLAVARKLDRFPIVAETYRECLQDYLRIDELCDILAKVQQGEIELSIVDRQTPSPFASAMLLDFQAVYQYEWDEPKATANASPSHKELGLIAELAGGRVDKALDEHIIRELDSRLLGVNARGRVGTAEELYELVRRLGDVAEEELELWAVDKQLLEPLLEEGRLVRITLPSAELPERVIADDLLEDYIRLARSEASEGDIRELLERHMTSRAVVIPTRIASRYGLLESTVQKVVDEMALGGELVEIRPDPQSGYRRWMSPMNLEIVYRRSLAAAKSRAELVSPERFSEFLVRWQHLHPATRVEGVEGLRTVLAQLEGVWAPFSVWQPDILGRRMSDFKPEYVDNLCLSAEFVWVGRSSSTDKAGDVVFLTRRGLSALQLPGSRPDEIPCLSPEAQQVLDCLERRGALFLMDIVVETRLESRVVQRALWELVWAGEVTYDHFGMVQALKPPEATVDVNASRRRDKRVYYRARARIARTFVSSPQPTPGRWTAIKSIPHYEFDDDERTEICARVLLERYGVVSKELAQRPGEIEASWAQLYRTYQRMELAGEIERGYFVEGLSGAQFALPEAVDELHRTQAESSSTGTSASEPTPILINTCDPACLFSTSGPFDTGFGKPNRLPSNYMVLLDGAPAVTVELGSGTIRVHPNLSMNDLETALRSLVHLVDNPWPIRPYRKVELTRFGDEPILGSPVEPILRSVGFERELRSLTLRSLI
ncbi:MAG: DEAD/DEAH box helicase [Armatimonadota bacterium]|nr:DEAD/DEAH box helicase [Armatimonadota bacterium]